MITLSIELNWFNSQLYTPGKCKQYYIGYATMVHGGGAIRIAVQLSQTWKLRHYDVITRKL